jgi:hypothetical protein
MGRVGVAAASGNASDPISVTEPPAGMVLQLLVDTDVGDLGGVEALEITDKLSLLRILRKANILCGESSCMLRLRSPKLDLLITFFRQIELPSLGLLMSLLVVEAVLFGSGKKWRGLGA